MRKVRTVKETYFGGIRRAAGAEIEMNEADIKTYVGLGIAKEIKEAKEEQPKPAKKK